MNQSTETEFFGARWNIYQKILEQNYMQHSEIYGIFHQFLAEKFQYPISVLDLGCGDAQFVAQALTGNKIKFYKGVDLSEVALKIAQENLAAIPGKKAFISGDFYQILQDLTKNSIESFDVVLASFSLHHLSLTHKETAIHSIYQLLKQQGVFFLIDVVRLPEESRDNYLDRYLQNIEQNWSLLTPEEVSLSGEHILTSDFPETLETLQKITANNGFSKLDCLYQDPKQTSRVIAFYKE